jgi:hypothetical protein
MINQNNENSNWKKLLGFRNMQEKLKKKILGLQIWYNLVIICTVEYFSVTPYLISHWTRLIWVAQTLIYTQQDN